MAIRDLAGSGQLSHTTDRPGEKLAKPISGAANYRERAGLKQRLAPPKEAGPYPSGMRLFLLSPQDVVSDNKGRPLSWAIFVFRLVRKFMRVQACGDNRLKYRARRYAQTTASLIRNRQPLACQELQPRRYSEGSSIHTQPTKPYLSAVPQNRATR